MSIPKRIASILEAPDRIYCQRLRANISRRQCSINQAQARIAPHTPLRNCLDCTQDDRPKPARTTILKSFACRTGKWGQRTKEARQGRNSQFGVDGNYCPECGAKTKLSDDVEGCTNCGWWR